MLDPGAVSKPPMLTARNTHGPGLNLPSGSDRCNKAKYGKSTQLLVREAVLLYYPLYIVLSAFQTR